MCVCACARARGGGTCKKMTNTVASITKKTSRSKDRLKAEWGLKIGMPG